MILSSPFLFPHLKKKICFLSAASPCHLSCLLSCVLKEASVAQIQSIRDQESYPKWIAHVKREKRGCVGALCWVVLLLWCQVGLFCGWLISLRCYAVFCCVAIHLLWCILLCCIKLHCVFCIVCYLAVCYTVIWCDEWPQQPLRTLKTFP